MRTKRWTRSPRGPLFGVVTGLAEWKDLDPAKTRFIVFLILLFTGIFPGAGIYLVLALILPAQTESDIIGAHRPSDPIDVSYEEAEDDSKAFKDRTFDKEKDWDERFRRGE